MDKDALGRFGEDVAARHLQSLGWRIIARRWRSGHNDLDLVAFDGNEVVFVEVKARSGIGYGWPEEAVGPAKQRELRRASWVYLMKAGWTARPYRIDVIGVVILPDGRPPQLRHFRSAVGEE
jgi:putative endonuclease